MIKLDFAEMLSMMAECGRKQPYENMESRSLKSLTMSQSLSIWDMYRVRSCLGTVAHKLVLSGTLANYYILGFHNLSDGLCIVLTLRRRCSGMQ